MATSRNFNRSYYKTRGRETVSITECDLPPEFRSPPRPKRPKASLRQEGEQAVAEFLARKKAELQPKK